MAWLFHRVPERMAGTVLYPLNALRDHDPESWRREVAKYERREHVLTKRVTPLDCLWNDVLHFSTVHPSLIAAELEAVGLNLTRRTFFQVDAEHLDPSRAVIFLNRHLEAGATDESQWLPFDAAGVLRLTEMTDATRRYYRESAELGERPLLYAYLPHVLFRGRLETRGLAVLAL